MLGVKVNYLYRDASNYKYRGEFFVSGSIDQADVSKLLFDGEFFIPSALGISSLVPLCMNNDDHLLHEIENLEVGFYDQVDMSDDVFMACLNKANARGWFRG